MATLRARRRELSGSRLLGARVHENGIGAVFEDVLAHQKLATVRARTLPPLVAAFSNELVSDIVAYIPAFMRADDMRRMHHVELRRMRLAQHNWLLAVLAVEAVVIEAEASVLFHGA